MADAKRHEIMHQKSIRHFKPQGYRLFDFHWLDRLNQLNHPSSRPIVKSEGEIKSDQTLGTDLPEEAVKLLEQRISSSIEFIISIKFTKFIGRESKRQEACGMRHDWLVSGENC